MSVSRWEYEALLARVEMLEADAEYSLDARTMLRKRIRMLEERLGVGRPEHPDHCLCDTCCMDASQEEIDLRIRRSNDRPGR